MLSGNGTSDEGNLGPDPLHIGGQTLQPDGNPLGGRFIPIDGKRTTEVVDSEIQVAIPIKVGGCQGVMDTGHVGPPLGGDVIEAVSTEVMKGGNGSIQFRVKSCVGHLLSDEGFTPGSRVRRAFALTWRIPHGVIGIQIMHIPIVSGRHQNVRITIQVDVEELRAPGSIGCSESGIIGKFRKRSIASCHMERIPRQLRTVTIGPHR